MKYLVLAAGLTQIAAASNLSAGDARLSNAQRPYLSAGIVPKFEEYPLSYHVEHQASLRRNSAQSEDPGGAAFKFNCPGDSVMIGIESSFSRDAKDRGFRFRCGWLSTPADRAEYFLQSKCTGPKTFALRDLGHEVGAPSDSGCKAGEVIGGAMSRWFVTDRAYGFSCCSIKFPGDKKAEVPAQKYAATSSCSTEQFNSQENFIHSCPAGQVITKVTTEYDGNRKDRKFRVTCCTVAEESPAPEAPAEESATP